MRVTLLWLVRVSDVTVPVFQSGLALSDLDDV